MKKMKIDVNITKLLGESRKKYDQCTHNLDCVKLKGKKC